MVVFFTSFFHIKVVKITVPRRCLSALFLKNCLKFLKSEVKFWDFLHQKMTIFDHFFRSKFHVKKCWFFIKNINFINIVYKNHKKWSNFDFFYIIFFDIKKRSKNFLKWKKKLTKSWVFQKMVFFGLLLKIII